MRTIESALRSLEHSGLRFEFLLVDNSTHQQLVTELQPPPSITMLLQPIRGKSAALNLAVRQAEAETLLFIDDDVELAPEAVLSAYEALPNSEILAVTGRIELAPGLAPPWFNPSKPDYYATTTDRTDNQAGTLVGAAMALRKDAFLEVPGFDPELGPGRLGLLEETLLSYQLYNAGSPPSNAHAIRVLHHVEPSRFLTSSRLAHRIALGRSAAYMQYHWRHEEVRRPGITRHMPRLLTRLNRLATRMVEGRHGPHSGWERLLGRLSYQSSMAQWIGSARHYDRIGLTKLRGDLNGYPVEALV